LITPAGAPPRLVDDHPFPLSIGTLLCPYGIAYCRIHGLFSKVQRHNSSSFFFFFIPLKPRVE